MIKDMLPSFIISRNVVKYKYKIYLFNAKLWAQRNPKSIPS